MRPLVVVVTGPTASGKTGLAIDIAERLGTEIISADSRQIYRDIPIITAAPTPEEQARVRHHLVGTLGLDQYYSAALFEQDALQLLEPLLDSRGVAVVAGGSTMYVDALVNGIDEMPAVSADVRAGVYAMSATERLEMLRRVDPDYAASADTANTKRVAHALEVSLQAGRPYSSFLTGQRKQRPFDVLKVAIDRSRDDLFDRINRRTQLMLGQGMEDEARRCYPLRHLNSLNTV
ncbi:MAG: tRNA (adenosine(37)-N6)-dimethylallyltransferase MiaA, partial [Bacteroidales bacterium]|nr:tRNA (adenosine(37)-N6)-dimethylallyltransferase MiaA [Bacteroidales bacterium]